MNPYNFEEIVEDETSKILSSKVIPDIFRACILLSEIANIKGADDGFSRFQTGKLYVLSLIDDDEFSTKSSVDIRKYRWGPVAISKRLSLQEGDKNPRFLINILQYIASLHPEKPVLSYLQYHDKRFFASVEEKLIEKWIGDHFISISEYNKIKTLAKIYASFDPAEIEVLSYARNSQMVCDYALFNIKRWPEHYYRACNMYTLPENTWGSVDKWLDEAGNWTKAAVNKINLFENKLPSIKNTIDEVVTGLSLEQKEFVEPLRNSINMEKDDENYKKIKYIALILNKLTTACRNAFSKCSCADVDPNDPLNVDLEQLYDVYSKAINLNVALGGINKMEFEFALEIIKNKNENCRVELGDGFSKLGKEIVRDLQASKSLSRDFY